MNNTRIAAIASLTFAGAVLLVSAIPATITAADWRLEIGNRSLYESNIFHSFADTLETDAYLDVLEARVAWRGRPAARFRHTVSAQADLDLYPAYSGRNKSSFGVAYVPSWRYYKNGELSLEAEIGRRNKDLIDDAGQVLARTLEKWELDVTATHSYDVGRLRTEVTGGYHLDDYDERETLAADGVTSVRLMSYDYDAFTWGVDARFRLSPRIDIRAGYDGEKRSYEERRTYTVRYGAFAGRPHEIREFTENTFDLGAAWKFLGRNTVSAEVEFARRKENFENFYGFDQRQYQASLTLYPATRHKSTVSFRFKNKDYENYWNSSIGRANRVWVDYADFEIEHEYRLSDLVTLGVYAVNFNKVSNDRMFDYHNFTAGTSIRFAL